MFKKIFCLVLSLSLLILAFSACSKSETESGASSTPSDITSSENAEENEENTDDFQSDDETTDDYETDFDDFEDEFVDEEVYYDELRVYNAEKPIITNYRASSSTIYHAFGFMKDDANGRVYTDKMLKTEVDRLADSGYRYVRTRYQSHWVWNNSKGWDFGSDRFGYFADYAKAMQEKNIEILLQIGWHFSYVSEIGSSSIGEVSYLKGRGEDRFGESKGFDFTGMSDEDVRLVKAGRRMGNFITKTLLELRSRGINNVNHLLYFVEPCNDYQGESSATREYVLVSRAIKDKMTEMGVANTVKHVGPNEVSRTGDNLLKYVLENDPDLFDIYSCHFYPKASSITMDVFPEMTLPVYTSYLNHMKEAGLFGKKEFWIDEYDTQASDLSVKTNSGWHGLQVASTAIVGQQLGIQNMIFWQLFDQLWTDNTSHGGEWEHGVHITGIVPTLFESPTPRDQYYTLGLFTKYNGYKNGTVYKTNNSQLIEDFAGIYIGAVKLEDGNWTVTVVNLDIMERNIKIKFDNAINRTLYRHQETVNTVKATPDAKLKDADATYLNVKDIVVDTVPAGSITVYTSIKGQIN